LNYLNSYFVKADLFEKGLKIAHTEQDFALKKIPQNPGQVGTFLGEFDLPDTLYLKMEFNKTMYFLDDVLVGKITLILSAKIPLKKMEFHILQSTQGGEHSSSEVLYKNVVKVEGILKSN